LSGGFLNIGRRKSKFIRDRNKHLAYDHRYLPIGYGATITDPWVVSIMTQILNPDFDHRVLEIGTGSGYQASILAELSNHVYSIEIIEELLDETDQIYNRMEKDYPEYANIIRKADDGYYGWEEYAPFERIIVTCGIDHIPPDLLKQLTPGGIMVIPVGPPSGQTLMKVEKKVDINGNIFFDREKIMSVKFIPFVTKEGHTR
jgi:protein-L-isoaspartate(D-aspartate) O-methyltransferase